MKSAPGDVDAADVDFDRAVTALADREQWREAIYVARHWAEILRAADREERAYAVLELATDFGQRIPNSHVIAHEPRRSLALPARPA